MTAPRRASRKVLVGGPFAGDASSSRPHDLIRHEQKKRQLACGCCGGFGIWSLQVSDLAQCASPQREFSKPNILLKGDCMGFRVSMSFFGGVVGRAVNLAPEVMSLQPGPSGPRRDTRRAPWF